MIQVIINLVLAEMMVKVVWVLGTHTLSPIKIIVGLVVVILCHLGVVMIQKWFIQKETGSLIHYIRGRMIILVLLVMLEVVLVLRQPNSTPQNVILAEACIMGGFFHIRVIT